MDGPASGRFDGVETPRGWVYTLPEDERMPVHWPEVVIGSLVVAVLFAAGAGLLGWSLWPAPGYEMTGGEPVLILFAALAFVLAGAVAVDTLRRHIGRHEIRLEPRAIRVTWRLGPASWSKTVPRSSVAQLTVVRRSRSLAPDRSEDDDFHALTTEDHAGLRQTLVVAYPRTLLLALATELSSRWKTMGIDPDWLDVGAKKLAVVEDTEVPTDVRDRTRPPRGTRLTLEPMGACGARIGRPPRGFASPAAVVLMLVAIMALGASAVVGLGAVLSRIEGSSWDELGRLAVLVVIGALALVTTVRLACAESWLTVTPDFLTLGTAGLTSTSSKTWTRSEIASIRVDVKVVPSSGSGEGPLCINRLLLRTTDAPRFSLVASAEEQALVQLLRKPRGAPDSAYLVVGSRTGPGTITDTVPLAAGRYEYAVRQETPTCKLGEMSRTLAIFAEPEEELDLGANLSKAELEWIATTLRGVLGVPASTV